MLVESLSVLDFRNLREGPVELSEGLNLIFGDNGQGKTNFLEAVSVCATGRSPRTRQDREMIRFERAEAHLRVQILRPETGRRDRIDVHLRKDGKKGLAVNGLGLKKSGELFGLLHTVSFAPGDLLLIQGGPSLRRRFLDLELCQLSRVYVNALQQYYHVLKQRNALLKTMRFRPADRELLPAFDEQLAYFAARLCRSRSAFVAELDTEARAAHAQLSGGREELSIEYRQSCTPEELPEKLAHSLDRDVALGQTGYGPHRDDLVFWLNGQEARVYGSQGQQRTAALSAKLAELSLIRNRLGEDPVLLLDDVLSELDTHRQQALWETAGQVQTLLTCTAADKQVLRAVPKRAFLVKDGVFLRQI